METVSFNTQLPRLAWALSSASMFTGCISATARRGSLPRDSNTKSHLTPREAGECSWLQVRERRDCGFCEQVTALATLHILAIQDTRKGETSLYNQNFPKKGFPSGSGIKNSPANAGDTGSIPGLGRSPGGGSGKPLQYSFLTNPMDRRAWQDYSPRSCKESGTT